jgi:hypothetical protein
MSNPQQSAQGSGGAKKGLTFKEMSGGQKTVFILKLAVCNRVVRDDLPEHHVRLSGP